MNLRSQLETKKNFGLRIWTPTVTLGSLRDRAMDVGIRFRYRTQYRSPVETELYFGLRFRDPGQRTVSIRDRVWRPNLLDSIGNRN